MSLAAVPTFVASDGSRVILSSSSQWSIHGTRPHSSCPESHERSARRCLNVILTIVDDYDNHMNGVDRAYQRRAAYAEPLTPPANAPDRTGCAYSSFCSTSPKSPWGTKVPRKMRVCRTYAKKTGRFVFHARTKDLNGRVR